MINPIPSMIFVTHEYKLCPNVDGFDSLLHYPSLLDWFSFVLICLGTLATTVS